MTQNEAQTCENDRRKEVNQLKKMMIEKKQMKSGLKHNTKEL